MVTISKSHIKSQKIEKKIKKYFRMTPPPFYPQKGQNGSKKGKLVKKIVTSSKFHIKSEKTKKILKKYFWSKW